MPSKKLEITSELVSRTDPEFSEVRWHCWLRHCATNRKVAVSIPIGVTGICYKPSIHIMALGLKYPVTEMSTRNNSGGLRRPVRRADILATFMCRYFLNMGAPTSWKPRGLSRYVQGLFLPLPLTLRM